MRALNHSFYSTTFLEHITYWAWCLTWSRTVSIPLGGWNLRVFLNFFCISGHEGYHIVTVNNNGSLWHWFSTYKMCSSLPLLPARGSNAKSPAMDVSICSVTKNYEWFCDILWQPCAPILCQLINTATTSIKLNMFHMSKPELNS